MRASKFEFERRFWIITGIYGVGFWLSVFDHTRFTTALRHLIAPSLSPGSPEATMFSQIVIAAGALLVFLGGCLAHMGGSLPSHRYCSRYRSALRGARS